MRHLRRLDGGNSPRNGPAGEAPVDTTDTEILDRLQQALDEAPMRGAHLQPLPDDLDDGFLDDLRVGVREFARPEDLREERLNAPEVEGGLFQLGLDRRPAFRARAGSENRFIAAIAALEAGSPEPIGEFQMELADRHGIAMSYLALSTGSSLHYLRFDFVGRYHLRDWLEGGARCGRNQA